MPGLSNAQTIGAGGRYNGLVKELGGPDTPCIGFASGISRVVLALKEQEITPPIKDYVDCFIMYVNEEEKKYALYLQQELRMAGFIVDTEYTSRSLKAQFKQADRLKSKFLLILNSADLDTGEVQIKNCKTKEEEKISVEYLIYYLDEKLVDDEAENFDLNSFQKGIEKDECDCGDHCCCDDDCAGDCDCNHHE